MTKVGWRKGNKTEVLGGVGLIHLQRGIALVDAEDIERVRGYTWRYRDKSGVVAYVSRKKDVLLSRMVLFGENHKAEKAVADHKNHNIFDNRKQNLRAATYRQNQHNQAPCRRGTSKYKGVYLPAGRKKWRAMIELNKKKRCLGNFSSEVEAARAYDAAALRLFGEFAYLNFRKGAISEVLDKD